MYLIIEKYFIANARSYCKLANYIQVVIYYAKLANIDNIKN